MSIVVFIQVGMRMSFESANEVLSVERILEYTNEKPEANLRDANYSSDNSSFVPLPSDWPSRGEIRFRNVFLRYVEHGKPILKDINLVIRPREKIGIVGRTGAGKSSLIAALFRLAKIEGVIEIDGIDTGKISLEDLRKNISIIPQDPVLFSGTLRRNLDPLNEFSDDELWRVLDEVELRGKLALDAKIADKGRDYSCGERQLVCLARAILRKNRILLLDEATANVDPQTDSLIQRTIRERLADCTVLTIAHRLNTVIDSDRVAVMDNGSLLKGYSKVLKFEDLYVTLKEDRSNYLGDRLERLGTPILLGKFLQYFKKETTTTFDEALTFGLAFTLTNFLTILSTNHVLFMAAHLGGRIRVAVCSLVYRKALKLSKTALGETAPGKIVNLVANDVNRFEWVMTFIHIMWSGPISTVIVAYILYSEAGYAGLIGIAVLMSTVPIQMYSAKLSSKFRGQTAMKTDERIRLMNEIVSGVQVIKMYSWEKPFCALIELARRLELNVIRKIANLRGLYMTFFLFTTRLALFCTIVSMVLFGQALSAEKVFVFASFFNVLGDSMTSMFIRGCAEIAECRVSVGRIQKFLMLDEFRPKNVNRTENHESDKDNRDIALKVMKKRAAMSGDEHEAEETDKYHNDWSEILLDQPHSIVMKNVTAKWTPNLSNPTLDSINLKLEKGKLYAVIGTVGSGKSSFLSAILGEINLVEGSIDVTGKVSYVPQDAWIFGASVRQNILFGQEFDAKLYKKVIKSCSLSKDFEQFPEGDHTIVGERGSSLSGGQRARINLARSVYRQADVYLFDDPLSAVDAHVGKHLFEECISRHLKGKTRILATHQLQFVKDVDGIILLDQGRIAYYEDHHQLLEAYPEYNVLIAGEKEEFEDDDASSQATELRRRFSSRSGSMIRRADETSIIEDDEEERKFEDIIEGTSKGLVKGNVFFQYFQAGSNVFVILIMTVLFVGTQMLVSMNDYCVPLIVRADESKNQTSSDEIEDSPNDAFFYIYLYTGVTVAVFVVGLTRTIVYYSRCMRSGEALHNRAFSALIRAPLRFFDDNPSGRILNRFSKDTIGIDELLTKAMLDAGQNLLNIAGALTLTCIVNQIFLAPALIIAVICYWIRKVYLKTSKNIKRLEGMTRSPVFTHLTATLNGLTTIRACNAHEVLKKEFDNFQDTNTSAWYLAITTSTAFGFSLDLFCFIFTALVTFSFLLIQTQIPAGSVGLAITQVMATTGMIQWGMRQSAEVANQLMSVERVLEYAFLSPEPNLQDKGLSSKQEKKKKKPQEEQELKPVPADWPQAGGVRFDNVFLQYADNDPPVIKELTMTINPTEKVGIVGRTGAGKSSLIAALFRLAKIEGVIEIDGIDTGKISLEDLRKNISIIPQDPVLFSGTLRRNLDPFNEFSDEQLWNVLDEVELKDAVKQTNNGLENRVHDRGSNYSVGQRQLICLARAILRNNRVLMLDEATANVDPQTDALIQKTIRTKFAPCTVLTVAHRLNTIMDSNKVLVMDKGRLVEFDHPHILLQDKFGEFTSLVKETGDAMYEQCARSPRNLTNASERYFVESEKT
ncbi:unnamed protein product [Trichogramma brassicae]|uniref:Uncharacterized protein n=1 Tax=Trichogramma brassicae TaxID=86971 RepID=A0A6H5IGV4_9HYME|nr:unnamed protein product [Trichogramma brassicae]